MTAKNILKIFTITFAAVVIAACVTKPRGSGAENFEKVPPGESAQISKIALQTTELQDMRSVLPEQMGKLLRGVHPKSHGCVSAEFIVNADIADEYRVGLFATPGKKYAALIRYSNASVKIAADLEDGKNGSRGMAIKLFDVPGEFLERDAGRQNQDFLMINTPEFAFSDVRGYAFLTDALHASPQGNDASKLLGLVLILAKINQQPPPFPQPTQQDLDKLGGFLASKNSRLPENFTLADLGDLTDTMNIVITKIQTRTVRNPLQVQYFGAAPFLFGPDRVMKFSAAPSEPVQQADFTSPPGDDYLGEALARSMQGKNPVSLDFKIQLRDSQADFGAGQRLIESASSTWDTPARREVDAYVDVAKIVIPAPQATTTDLARVACENLVFTPWHSLKVHQPVGGINRLRRSVYENSATHRGANDK